MRLAGLLALSLSLLVVPSAEQTADARGVKLPVKSPGPRKALARPAEASRFWRELPEALDARPQPRSGQVAHPDPFFSAMEATEDGRPDETIVSTFPGERSGWLRRDLVGRLRFESGLPVDHIVAESPVEVRA